MVESSRYCYEDFDSFDEKAAKKNLRPVILEPMRAARKEMELLSDWTKESISTLIEDIASRHNLNMGKLGQPIRVAITGGPVSPPIDTTVWLVGRERTLRRMDKAIEFISRRAAEAAG